MSLRYCARVARRDIFCIRFAVAIVAATTILGFNPTTANSQCWSQGLGVPLNGPAAEAVPVEMFAAIERGQVQARVIVRDPYHAKLLLTNPGIAAIALRLPEFVGARPVATVNANVQPAFLAQQGFFGQPGNGPNFGNPNRQGGSSPAPQSVGGAIRPNFGQQLGMNQQAGNGNNVFNIAPERVRIIDIACVCLDPGAPDPRSTVAYELVPLTTLNADSRLPEVLRGYVRGEVERDVAQAAAWHVAKDVSWDRLARMSVQTAINAERPLFAASQLHSARALVENATRTADAASKIAAKSPRRSVEGRALDSTTQRDPERSVEVGSANRSPIPAEWSTKSSASKARLR